jgi:putative membrane protein
MTKSTVLSITMGAMLALAAQAQTQSGRQAQAAPQDSDFIKQAAQANLAEVKEGKLGTRKAQNEQVKQFCQNMVTDHQNANQKLRPIAQREGVKISRSLDAEHKQQLSQLRKLKGADFDKEFATTALKGHAETIALFQREAQQGQDPAVKEYAQSMLPELQHHLDMAKNMAKNVGLDETSISSILKQFPEAIGGTGAGSTGQEKGAGTSQSQPETQK